EATDVVLWEAVQAGPPVWEVDTTGRSVRSIAREVETALERGIGHAPGSVDWLSRRSVTEQLLPRLR
ncbi:MAG: kinase, partial [Thermoplasmata archaeon]|nr:kinase [Thermoplasmata archaeon]